MDWKTRNAILRDSSFIIYDPNDLDVNRLQFDFSKETDSLYVGYNYPLDERDTRPLCFQIEGLKANVQEMPTIKFTRCADTSHINLCEPEEYFRRLKSMFDRLSARISEEIRNMKWFDSSMNIDDICSSFRSLYISEQSVGKELTFAATDIGARFFVEHTTLCSINHCSSKYFYDHMTNNPMSGVFCLPDIKKCEIGSYKYLSEIEMVQLLAFD